MSSIKHPRLNRRQFIQYAAGSALATIGMSHSDIIQQGNRYAQVLAQSTPRKLALLVGINQYSGKIPLLEGCVNDVLLQRELLIHRFGFNPKDILTVTDTQATRKGILTAFEEHLIKQAKPGDVVVFHFSGHGSRISDKPSCDEIALKLSDVCTNSTLMPIDSRTQGAVRDIMGHTLFLLMSALKTENVTLVLDSCHSGGGKRGNFRVRSYDSLDDSEDFPEPSQEELEYQRQWLGKLKLSAEEFIEKRRKSVAKGIVIASVKRDQEAVDATFDDGFHAGAFTYLFTQYLWQQTGNESLKRTIVNVSRSTQILALKQKTRQEPEFESNLNKGNLNPPIYFTNMSASSADAVITQSNGDRVELWLGGLDSQSLSAFERDSIFTVLDANGDRGLIKLESRKGLVGYGKVLNTTQSPIVPGTLLQERIRGIPKELTLKIGLDDTSLDRNTTEQAKQALQNIPRMQPLPLGQQEVQYIFGRMTEAKYQQLQKGKVANLPAVGSFGLFLPTLDQIIPGSFGNATEAVSTAVTRLKPKLKSLLAARIVKQMLGNTNTSQIAVVASMVITGNNKVVAETFPIRGLNKTSNNSNTPVKIVNSDANVPQLPLGTQVAFQVKSYETVPLYISILVIDAAGNMAVLYPNDWSASESAVQLGAEQLLIVPQAGVDEFAIAASEPLGLTEALIIASTTPLRDSLKALKEIASSRGVSKRSPIAVDDDDLLNVSNSLLDDLDRGTRGDTTGSDIVPGVRGIDTQKLAAMTISFEIVAS